VKAWTVLVYLCGDDAPGGLEDASIDDFNEMEQVGSGPDVNIVVQWDREAGTDALDTLAPGDTAQSWDTTRRYYVVKDPFQVPDPQTGQPNPMGQLIYSPALDDLGEVDMGDPEELVAFVEWGLSRFPAQRYFVVLWDHGNDWKPRSRAQSRGIIFDYTGPAGAGSFITNAGLRQAFNEIKQFNGGKAVDVVGMDGCSMGSLEIAYQMRGVADYLIASSILVPYDGYAYDLFLQDMADHPNQALAVFFDTFVTDYVNSYRTGGPQRGAGSSVTLGVYDLSRVETLAQKVDNLALFLTENLRTYVDEITVARSQTQSAFFLLTGTSGTPGSEAERLDIFDLGLNLKAQIRDPELEALADELMAAVEKPTGLVVAEGHLTGTLAGEPNVDDMHGIGLYFPPSTISYNPEYEQVLDFTANYGWDEFLRTYINLFRDITPPQIFISYPPNGATIQNSRPTITASITDTGDGRVDPSTIEFIFDGRTVEAKDYTFDLATGLLHYQPPSDLAATSHTISLTAADLAGNVSDKAFSTFRIAPPVLTRGLRMLAIPLGLQSADPATVFGTQDFQMARWVPNAPGTNKYFYYPDDYASLIPPDTEGADPTVPNPPAGLGYWVQLPLDTPVVIGIGKPISASTGYPIKLRTDAQGRPSWNMVGNPFNEVIGWGSVQFRRAGRRLTLLRAVEAGWTNGILYQYDPNIRNPDLAGSYSFTGLGEGRLEPWRAYWVLANQDVELIIYPGGGVRGEEPPSESVDPPAWEIKLSASAGDLSDPMNFFGVALAAQAGYDRYDVAEPPPLPNSLSLSFPHPNWGRQAGAYARDVQPAGAGETTWQFVVEAPPGGEEVTLTWDGLRQVPPETYLWLTDETAARTVSLRTQAAYRYRPAPSGERRAFQLRAGPAGGRTPLAIVDLRLTPGRGGEQNVAYTLTRAATVGMRILSPGGQVIWTQPPAGEQQAGRRVQVWPGRDALGRPVPNGLYLVEVTATTAEGEVQRAIGQFSWRGQ